MNIQSEIQSLRARIAKKEQRHENTSDLHGQLVRLMVKQLRRENRQDKKARAA